VQVSTSFDYKYSKPVPQRRYHGYSSIREDQTRHTYLNGALN